MARKPSVSPQKRLTAVHWRKGDSLGLLSLTFPPGIDEGANDELSIELGVRIVLPTLSGFLATNVNFSGLHPDTRTLPYSLIDDGFQRVLRLPLAEEYTQYDAFWVGEVTGDGLFNPFLVAQGAPGSAQGGTVNVFFNGNRLTAPNTTIEVYGYIRNGGVTPYAGAGIDYTAQFRSYRLKDTSTGFNLNLVSGVLSGNNDAVTNSAAFTSELNTVYNLSDNGMLDWDGDLSIIDHMAAVSWLTNSDNSCSIERPL